jgi:hypothetical protein
MPSSFMILSSKVAACHMHTCWQGTGWTTAQSRPLPHPVHFFINNEEELSLMADLS